MNRLWKVLLAGLFLSFGVSAAQAGILEIRGGFGLNTIDDDDFEKRANAINNDGADLNDFDTYNVDVFINLPLFPIGFGLRQEWMDVDSDSTGSNLDLEAQKLSLLVDFRIIDTGFYIGPILGIGHPSAKIDYDTSSASIDKDLDADELSYSLGLEAGTTLGMFLIGAEAGYQSLKFESTGDPTLNTKVDLSGFYGKVMAGLTFF